MLFGSEGAGGVLGTGADRPAGDRHWPGGGAGAQDPGSDRRGDLQALERAVGKIPGETGAVPESLRILSGSGS